MRNIQRMETVFMKNKLFFLCLLAALSYAHASCTQKNDVGSKIADKQDSTTSAANPLGYIEDSLKQAIEYYKNSSNWIFIVEEPVVVIGDQSTSFDNAGLKHAFFSWEYRYICIPKSSDLKYIPRIHVITDSYGERLPIEGKDMSHFQMIRNAVFPFAANFPKEMTSKAILQKYANKEFEFPNAFETESKWVFEVVWEEEMIEQYHLVNGLNLDTLTSEKKSLAIWSNIRNLWCKNVWHGKKHKGNTYIVAAGSIADTLKKYQETYTHFINVDGDDIGSSSYNSYIMLNHNTVLEHHSGKYSFSQQTYSNEGEEALMISDSHTIRVDLQSCLKDTSYKVISFARNPGYEYGDCYDIVSYENKNELQKKIIPLLKEGSILYDYYVQNFYMTDDDVFTFLKFNKIRCEGGGNSQSKSLNDENDDR